jgi:hypothetical protein
MHCNLKYKPLSAAQMQAKIQVCLDQTKDQEPDGWLIVGNWFQEAMQPAGTVTSRATLDVLRTRRPIFVLSSFGHTALANTRALELAHLTVSTPDPLGGKIGREPSGNPSGILEDAAFQAVESILPKPTPVEDIKAAQAALNALREQGVTTFLDAAATPETLAAFAGAEKAGKLTARAHFAVLIRPPEGPQPGKAVVFLKAMAQRYDEGEIVAEPHMTVRNVKLFLDGVITAPALTGAMLMPYITNHGTAASPHWVESKNRGPDVYFPAGVLSTLVIEAARAGFEAHMHADGDRAVREGLDAVEALRKQFSGRDIRAAIAHDEIVDPADFPRFAKLDVIPVLSDGGLTRTQVLRAITINSAYELHQDKQTGSLEVGKFADLLILDRNFFEIPAEQIADIKVLSTIVGGRVVYQAADPDGRAAELPLHPGNTFGADNSNYPSGDEHTKGLFELDQFAHLIVLDR